jgi:hypothetical protein
MTGIQVPGRKLKLLKIDEIGNRWISGGVLQEPDQVNRGIADGLGGFGGIIRPVAEVPGDFRWIIR